MNSLAEGFIERQPINQKLLQTIRLLGEYKEKQELFKQQAPQVLQTLRQAVIIQSPESSNRIEGYHTNSPPEKTHKCMGRGVDARWQKRQKQL